jgi:hypothetical protein
MNECLRTLILMRNTKDRVLRVLVRHFIHRDIELIRSKKCVSSF